MAIASFCTSELQEKQQYSKTQTVLMSNFSFLLKMSLMQVIFVGMAMLPIVGLGTLLSLEILYTVATVGV